MTEPTNAKLFVNLGASQTRRRLKGFGHGVRKVETAGNNQAVIIHTATGQHLRQLAKKFADVGYSKTELGLGKPADLIGVLADAIAEADEPSGQEHDDSSE